MLKPGQVWGQNTVVTLFFRQARPVRWDGVMAGAGSRLIAFTSQAAQQSVTNSC